MAMSHYPPRHSFGGVSALPQSSHSAHRTDAGISGADMTNQTNKQSSNRSNPSANRATFLIRSPLLCSMLLNIVFDIYTSLHSDNDSEGRASEQAGAGILAR